MKKKTLILTAYSIIILTLSYLLNDNTIFQYIKLALIIGSFIYAFFKLDGEKYYSNRKKNVEHLFKNKDLNKCFDVSSVDNKNSWFDIITVIVVLLVALISVFIL